MPENQINILLTNDDGINSPGFGQPLNVFPNWDM